MVTFATVGDRMSGVRQRVVNALQSAHVAHEAKLLKTLVADTVEDTAYQARRAARSARHHVEDMQENVAHRVRRHPIAGVGLALGAGLLLGAVAGWGLSRMGSCERHGGESWQS
jgi:ElaB/YqjD/DUF883 family membrane-anchored ribosome-binding protein